MQFTGSLAPLSSLPFSGEIICLSPCRVPADLCTAECRKPIACVPRATDVVRAAVYLLIVCWVTTFGTATVCEAKVPADEDNLPADQQLAAQRSVLFEESVQPILDAHCISCHGPESQEGELRLDSLQGLAAGGKSGSIIIPNRPEESLMALAVRYHDESLQMPPDGKLSEHQVQQIFDWIEQGARHPEGRISVKDSVVPFDVEKSRQFWSFVPPTKPAIPEVQFSQAVLTPIDAFVVARLEKAGLYPADVADKRTLIRRASLILTGLPPTPEDIERFLSDTAANAFEKVIDRLLASPAYGERWGRHWLDVVRYADSNGLDENVAHGNAFRFRDYIVASFNADKPFDQLVQEHIAGDLLITEDMSESRKHELLIGTGFLSLGPKVLAEADKTKMLMDILDEQIDTTGRALMGLTLGCARCHDHKFDPISQADYYSMLGIFKSTHTMDSLKTIAQWHEHSVETKDDEQRRKQHQADIEAKKAEIANLINSARARLMSDVSDSEAEKQFPEDVRSRLISLRAEQVRLEETLPESPTAMGVKEGETVVARINIRGSHLSPGRAVARGVPVVLQLGGNLQIPEDQSGRLQFARWLTDPRHPLTARVMVNRVWRWHFGTGIVPSTDNFGHLGEKPVNPELLDWLACEFIENGWSMKQLHRTIMLSRTWQLSGEGNLDAEQRDPENSLNWRFSMQRLQAEVLRDSILAVSGQLDRTMGGSLLHVKNREFFFNHTSKDETRYDQPRRSIYLPVVRNNLYDGFALFDCTDAAVSNSNRATSTVASQALFMMNSNLLVQASEKLAEKLLAEASREDDLRIQWLYERALGRPANAAETETILKSLRMLKQQMSKARLSNDDDVSGSSARPLSKSSNRLIVSADSLQPDSVNSELGAPDELNGLPESSNVLSSWMLICHSVLASSEFMYVQ